MYIRTRRFLTQAPGLLDRTRIEQRALFGCGGRGTSPMLREHRRRTHCTQYLPSRSTSWTILDLSKTGRSGGGDTAKPSPDGVFDEQEESPHGQLLQWASTSQREASEAFMKLSLRMIRPRTGSRRSCCDLS